MNFGDQMFVPWPLGEERRVLNLASLPWMDMVASVSGRVACVFLGGWQVYFWELMAMWHVYFGRVAGVFLAVCVFSHAPLHHR